MTQGRNPPHILYRQMRWSPLRHRHRNGTNKRDGRPSPAEPPELVRWQLWNTPTNSGGGEGVMKISVVRPLSVEAVQFTPASATEQHIRSGRKTMSSGTGGSSPTEVVEPPLSTAGGGGGVRFTAVAEVHRPPSMDNEEKLLAQARQHAVENTDPGEAPVILSAPRGDTLVSKCIRPRRKSWTVYLWRRQSTWNRY